MPHKGPPTLTHFILSQPIRGKGGFKFTEKAFTQYFGQKIYIADFLKFLPHISDIQPVLLDHNEMCRDVLSDRMIFLSENQIDPTVFRNSDTDGFPIWNHQVICF